MYCIATLKNINAIAAKKPPAENAFSRQSSWLESTSGGKKGIVLHSASQRSTGWIEGAAARNFKLEILSTNSSAKRNSIIENYFSAVPRGKQRVSVTVG